MHAHEGRLRFSPSDLANFLEGDFVAWMDRWFIESSRDGGGRSLSEEERANSAFFGVAECRPDEPSEELAIIAARGNDHEAKFLQELRSSGIDVVAVERSSFPERATMEAMRRGADCIYQACLADDRFLGFADFLRKTQGESSLGDFHYEAADTKLARSVKASFVVQLCAYADLLGHVQGRLPDAFEIVLGNGTRERYRTNRFVHYFRALKAAYLKFQDGFDPACMPPPGLSRSHGRWSGFAQEYLAASEHLCMVANISRNQICRLEAAGVKSVPDLANCSLDPPLPLARPVLNRLRTQARLQLASRGCEKPLYELQPIDADNPRRGFALLPPASPSDVYFDIEGFPLCDDGLEYLLGVVFEEQGRLVFRDWWAHDDRQERRSFEEFIDWAHARWRADPSLHIYHYAAYETTAVRRLMGKHGTREREVDDLLRNHVFVDLYNVVRQGLTIGTPSYSLKEVERLFMPARDGSVKTAGGSIVAYHDWMESGQSQDWRESSLLKAIRDYNEQDCVATCELAKWLRGVQAESNRPYVPPGSVADEPPVEKELPPSALLAAELREAAERSSDQDPERSRVQELLSWLLEFHWREAKPVFWRMFDRHEMSEEALFDDFDCLAGLERTATPPSPIKRSFEYEYQFDPNQETKLSTGSTCYFAHDLAISTEITDLDAGSGLVWVKVGPKAGTPPSRLSLIPNEHVSAKAIADAVHRYAKAWASGESVSSAVDDLLFRRKPRIRGIRPGDPLVPSAGDLVEGTVKTICDMDRTALAIQGPPGTGKTYTAGQAIVELVRRGAKIGVTSNSHKAILNLLRRVRETLPKDLSHVPVYKVGGDGDDSMIKSGEIQWIESNEANDYLDDGGAVMGGTAWLFARPELQDRFDYLFVDEAGQFSLANAVGVGLAAKNLVLVGDQMQLAQPTLGSHPGESGWSVLEYLLDGHDTIPPDVGVFLETTRRMHPAICRFVSDSTYEGRLHSHKGTASQRLVPPNAYDDRCIDREAGILFVPVEHDGYSQECEHEVDAIERIVQELLQSSVCDFGDRKPRPMRPDDILIVAPFNLQVQKLKDRLGPGIRVGSVDKFQGQEAHVAIVSLCSSTLEDSPRGAEFLLDPNRMNVAVSRAKTLAIVVGSPTLMAARCRTVREMELVNRLCWLAAHASECKQASA